MSSHLMDLEEHAATLKHALLACEIMADGSCGTPQPETLAGLFNLLHGRAQDLEHSLRAYLDERRQSILKTNP